jgi:hypothetical protein
MDAAEARARIAAEMRRAVASRAAGNEGRARVCARRAAGFGLALVWGSSERPNAYDLLRRAADDPSLTEAVRQASARLSVRVTQAHQLPHLEDPLADARLILGVLGYGFETQDDAHVDRFDHTT